MDQSITPRPTIEMLSVQSGLLARVGYDDSTKTLAIVFNGKPTEYHYPNVDRSTYEALINAESIGRYFGQNIKGLPFNQY